jgi:hypothetical protein
MKMQQCCILWLSLRHYSINNPYFMSRKIVFFVFMFGIVCLLANCKQDDPIIPNEEEVITTLTYTLVPSNGGASATLSFKDLDGDGGTAPTITGDTLAANQTYVGTLTLLNEIELPIVSIDDEIEEEGDVHQFFFQSTVSDMTFTYNDQDVAGNPIGLSSQLTTGNAAAGYLTITLRHEPDKLATGVSNGDITNAGGETDIEVTFPIYVQ